MESFLPDISYEAAALAEWMACLMYWIYARKRFGKWRTVIFAGLLLAGQLYLHTHIFIWLPSSLLWESGFGILLARAIGVMANVLFMFAGTLFLTQYPLPNLIYITANAFVIAELTASTGCILYDLWVMAGGGTGSVQAAVFYGGICVLSFLSLYRSVEQESHGLKRIHLTANQSVLVMLVACSAFFISNSSIVLTQMQFTSAESMLDRAILRLVGDLCGFMTLWVMSKSISENEIREELSAVKTAMDAQYEQYLSFRDTSEYISRQNHDLKHQIRALKESASDAERNAYIAEMEQVIALNEAWNMSGNSALDCILTQKKMQCIGRGITFTCQANVQNASFLSVRDTSSLFGNIIDNAIEYVSAFEEEEKRVIRGCVEIKRSFLIAAFENYYEGPPVPVGQMPRTTKKDKEMHGIGLKSIRYITEKYNGTFRIQTEDHWFTVRVMIPLHTES